MTTNGPEAAAAQPEPPLADEIIGVISEAKTLLEQALAKINELEGQNHELRRKLAKAGVEGSPPPGEETLIGILNARLRAAEEVCRILTSKEWDGPEGGASHLRTIRKATNAAIALQLDRSPLGHPRAFVAKVLKLFWKYGENPRLMWTVSEDGLDRVRFFANVSDLFAWGGADAEEITEGNFHELETAFADCYKRDPDYGPSHAGDLFAARVRKMRPQEAAYPESEKLRPLFDACGPEREPGIGNPNKHPVPKDATTPPNVGYPGD